MKRTCGSGCKKRWSARATTDPRGHDVRVAPDGEAALKLLEETNVDVMLCDINMPRMDGMELLRRVHQRPNPPEVIMLTGHATVETAIEAMKLGAYDYL